MATSEVYTKSFAAYKIKTKRSGIYMYLHNGNEEKKIM